MLRKRCSRTFSLLYGIKLNFKLQVQGSILQLVYWRNESQHHCIHQFVASRSGRIPDDWSCTDYYYRLCCYHGITSDLVVQSPLNINTTDQKLFSLQKHLVCVLSADEWWVIIMQSLDSHFEFFKVKYFC